MNQFANLNTVSASKDETSSALPAREWLAKIDLGFEQKSGKTVLAHVEHLGPLRVQRPFYPEAGGCCHIYLLHPPGGIAIGDKLSINLDARSGSTLLTTPSAGKIYGIKGLAEANASVQGQECKFKIAAGACIEWLPQETIVFNAAQAQLKLQVDLEKGASFFGWDIVRLGRAASGETFDTGFCLQSLHINRDGKPLYIEKNKVHAGSAFTTERWGLNNKNTFATLVATGCLSREKIDSLYETLHNNAMEHCSEALWALTQKDQVFIARYLGNSIIDCRAGMEILWCETRTEFKNTNAEPPRIWNT